MTVVGNSALRAQLGSSLKGLQQSLGELAQFICAQAHDAWLWRKPTQPVNAFSESPMEYSRAETLKGIAEGLQQIKYRRESQDPHETDVFPGLVAVPPEGLVRAREVNRWKVELASVLRAMADRTEVGVVNQETGEKGPRPLREVALEAFFFRRLNHWQAVRRIEVISGSIEEGGPPDYMGFMWANSREVRRTTREELLTQVEGEPARNLTDRDIEVLELLPPREPLAIVTPGNTSPKVNVHWPAHREFPGRATVRPAVLPIILGGNRMPERWRKLPPAPTPKRFRLARGDTEVETTPLLESLPVYRYLEHLRARKRKVIGR